MITNETELSEVFRNMLGPSGRPEAPRKNKGRKPKYVRFHPQDNPGIYPDTLFEHPDEYVPNKDWEGRIIFWGLSPIIPQGAPGAGYVDNGDMELFMARKMAGNLYLPFHQNPAFKETPEQQFVNRLIENQIKKLESMDLGDLTRRDYTLKIVMDGIKTSHGHDMIWRETRVSGGLSIAALADKVITPLMGWTRNYHAHAFTVHKDGAVYGPTESKAIDMMHLQSIGYAAVPEKSDRGVWTLAHLLQAEGETMIWVYDYGSNWTHHITVEEIAPVSESNGKVAILDGAGACPCEDASGNHDWADDVQKLASDSLQVRDEVLSEIRRSMNYKDRTIGATFDPEDFDIAQARARVHAALASPDSVSSGSKVFIHPLHPDALDKSNLSEPLKKGQTLERTWDEGDGPRVGGAFMQEVTSSRRDKKLSGCCYTCGSPHDLLGCSGCRKTLYCGSECQKAHWKAGHKAQCLRQKPGKA